MKKLLTTMMMLTIFVMAANAQQKVKYSDIEGKKWKLTIDITEEIEKELDDSDSFFERLVIKSVSGLVDNILDEIDIYFEFQSDNRLKVTSQVLWEDDVEYTSWRISKRGALIIDDTDNFKTSGDSEWYLMDDVLVVLDDDHDIDDVHVYLVAVED